MNALATVDRDMARVVESLVLRGDISALNPTERATYYMQTCEGLGLNPHSHPFAFLKLNGKEVMYATRGATDQLAAQARVNREIIDGPKVIDLAGTKLVYALCRATLPNGRFETAVATVPLTDPVNVLMKCETKAKRRATLSILGLGLLDEVELETIPENVKEPGGGVDISLAKPRGLNPPAPEPPRDDEDEAQREREAIQSEGKVTEPPRENSPLARLTLGLTVVTNLSEMTALWKELGQPLNTAGSATEGRKLATQHLADRGYPLTAAAMTAVLAATMPAPLRDVYDALAELNPQRPIEDAAWVLRNLGARLVEQDKPEARKATVRRLEALGVPDAKAQLTAAMAPKGDGPGNGGGQRPAAAQNTTANGSAAASSQSDGTTMLVTPELIEWRKHLASKSWRGADQGAAAIAGAWWKHSTGKGEIVGWSRVQQNLAYTSTLDELTARGVEEPHTFLTKIGVLNKVIEAPEMKSEAA